MVSFLPLIEANVDADVSKFVGLEIQEGVGFILTEEKFTQTNING